MEADPAARSALDREAAVLSEQKLDDLERAAVNWRQIAARDVLAREAATALDRLYADLDMPQELAFALELRRNQEGQSPQGRELAFRLAALRQNRLNDPRGALEVYRQILSEDPTHEGTREALEAWARGNDGESSAAAEILDAVLARTGDHQKRIAIREARQLHATTQTERARLSTEIRAILERDLNQPEAAFMNALKAFTDGLDRDAVQGELERLARVTGSFGELAEIYESTVEELPAGDEHVIALLRRAAELREQLAEPEEATRVWKQLLEHAPAGSAGPRQPLAALREVEERQEPVRRVRQAGRAGDRAPAERFGLLLKAGEAFEAAGDDAQAIEALKPALAIKGAREVLAVPRPALRQDPPRARAGRRALAAGRDRRRARRAAAARAQARPPAREGRAAHRGPARVRGGARALAAPSRRPSPRLERLLARATARRWRPPGCSRRVTAS